MMSPAETALLFVGFMGALLNIEGSLIKTDVHNSALVPVQRSAVTNRLRGRNSTASNTSASLHALGGASQGAPCQCDLGKPTWVPCARTVPKCFFIDLGAADGNTLQAFVDGKYGPVQNCPSGGQWQATLVEANPRFTDPLKRLEVLYPGVVYSAASTAAYMCDAQTTFYLDTQNHDQNYWGSSMSENHVDTKASGHQAVTVPTMNILKLLYESTTVQDYVILKMDIEGAEWDVLPCLANSQYAGLIDRLLVEVHPQSWGNVGTTQANLDSALSTLKAKGVDIPDAYHSKTF